MFRGVDVKEKIVMALFLLEESPSPLLLALRPDWPDLSSDPLVKRTAFLEQKGFTVDLNAFFPLREKLSAHLSDFSGFAYAHLEQPRLFLRIRPGYEDIVPEKLFKAGIPFNKLDHVIELANRTDIENVLVVDKEVVVQDLSSQRIKEVMKEIRNHLPDHPNVWDACAASGGKSLLLYDTQPKINLVASDVRSSILDNLKKRFAAARLQNYHSFVTDLTKTQPDLRPQDLVMADVPCSGSGTWGRTPEALLFFNDQQLNQYVELQRKIIDHTLPLVSKNGHYLYMTCSVYAAENEDQVSYISSKGFQLRKMVLLEGWQHHADSLFAAWFTR